MVRLVCGSARWLIAVTFVMAVSSGLARAADQEPGKAPAEAVSEKGHDAGASSAGHAGAGGGPITWQSDLAIWTLVLFIVLLVVLRQIAWKPLSEALDAREHGVRANVERAEQARRDAERLLDEHRKKLDLVQDEVRAILEEARRDAVSTAQGIVAKAEQESRATQQRSLREVERARDQALRDIAQQAADLVAAAAGRVVRTSLTGPEHRRLIEESLAEFGKSSPGH